MAASKPWRDYSVSSMTIFRRHLYASALEHGVNDESSGRRAMDGERVISKACFDEWQRTRSGAVKKPELTFQRVLTCFVTATDGRHPFTPDEEMAILKAIRMKRVWFVAHDAGAISQRDRPAFEGTAFTIGRKGFRALGCVSDQQQPNLVIDTTRRMHWALCPRRPLTNESLPSEQVQNALARNRNRAQTSSSTILLHASRLFPAFLVRRK